MPDEIQIKNIQFPNICVSQTLQIVCNPIKRSLQEARIRQKQSKYRAGLAGREGWEGKGVREEREQRGLRGRTREGLVAL